MQKSIANAIANRYTFDSVEKVKGRYIGHFTMKNGYAGGITEHSTDMGSCEEYTKEITSNGGTLIKRNGEKIFSFGP